MGSPGSPETIVGVDIGGTTVKAIVVDGAGRVVGRHVGPTFGVSSSALDGVHTVLDRVFADAQRARHRPAAIGACTPGAVDDSTGIVAYAANLGWKDLPLAQQLSARYGVPVRVQHDARAAAAAEVRQRGVAAEVHLLFVPLGTGLAVAATLPGGGTGARGAAGELGHVIVRPGGERCACGQTGCVEAYAGGRSILRRYRERGGRAGSVEQIVSRIATDPLAATVWDEALAALASGLHGAVALLDPDLIVLGGGMARAGERLRAPIEARLRDLFTWRAPPPVALSALASFGGLIGSTLLVAPRFTKIEVDTMARGLAGTAAPRGSGT